MQLRHDGPRDAGAPKLQTQSALGVTAAPAGTDVSGEGDAGHGDADAVTDTEDAAAPAAHRDPLLVDPAVDREGVTWIEHVIGRSVARVRAEDFPAIPDPDACRYCVHARSCPAKLEGRVITP